MDFKKLGEYPIPGPELSEALDKYTPEEARKKLEALMMQMDLKSELRLLIEQRIYEERYGGRFQQIELPKQTPWSRLKGLFFR